MEARAYVRTARYAPGRPTIPQLLCCMNFRFTTIAYIIMTMRVFIRNIAGSDSSR